VAYPKPSIQIIIGCDLINSHLIMFCCEAMNSLCIKEMGMLIYNRF